MDVDLDLFIVKSIGVSEDWLLKRGKPLTYLQWLMSSESWVDKFFRVNFVLLRAYVCKPSARKVCL